MVQWQNLVYAVMLLKLRIRRRERGTIKDLAWMQKLLDDETSDDSDVAEESSDSGDEIGTGLGTGWLNQMGVGVWLGEIGTGWLNRMDGGDWLGEIGTGWINQMD